MILLLAVVLTRLVSSDEQLPDAVTTEAAEVQVETLQPSEPEETTETEETAEAVLVLETAEPVATEYASYDVLQEERKAEAQASMDLIMHLVVAEAGNQGYDGMRAVAQVIYDRLYNSSYDFGQTIEEVIKAPGQFATPYSGDISAWQPTVQEACEAVFYQQDMYFDEPVHYFYVASRVEDSTLRWFETKKLVGVLGAHTFRSDS